jgi:imidazole glycerol phosphate synthase subunit HisF
MNIGCTVKVGDLVKVGGTLRPSWYGETGIIISLDVNSIYAADTDHSWYRVALISGREKTIRNDVLEVINESR